MKKKSYDKEFKRQVVHMVQNQGKAIPLVAREMDLHNSTVYRWVAEFKQERSKSNFRSGQQKPDQMAFRYMLKRIRDLEEENDILKKATHFFTKDGR
ncbi:Transposase [compost metagenome]